MRRLNNMQLNGLALYANFIILALIGLVANPLQLKFLGAEAFGIWKSCLRILDLTSVADGRATQALKWIIAHQSGAADGDKMRREVGSAVAVWLLWLPILVVAICGAVWALPTLITHIPPEQLIMARFTAGLLGLNVIISALLSIPDSVLAGTNQGFRSYIVTTIFLVFSNVVMVVAVWQGYGTPGMALATLSGSLLTGCVSMFVARRHVDWWGIRRPTWADVKRILSFSNWTQVWSIVQITMLSTEILLIGYLVGPKLVSHYTFTSYVAAFALSICLMTGSAVTPRLGELVGSKNLSEAANLHNRTREVLISIALAAACGLIMCNRIFVTNWVGVDFYLGDVTNFVMVIVMTQLILLRFDSQIQDVGLEIRGKVVAGCCGALMAIVLGLMAFRVTGNLATMFVGIFFGRLPLNFILPIQVRRIIPGASSHPLAMVGITFTLLLTFGISQVWRPTGWSGLASTAVVSLMIAAAASVAFNLSQSSRKIVYRQIRDISKVRNA